MIRLFATDLDGTLLVDGRIPAENAQAIRTLQERGVTVCLASGRAAGSIEWLAAEAGLQVGVIGSNGSIAIDEEGKVRLERIIAPETVKQLINIGESYKVHYHFYDRDTFFMPRLDPRSVVHLKVREDRRGMEYQCNLHVQRNLYALADTMKAMKVQYVTSFENDEAIEEELRKLDGLAVTRSGPFLVEAMEESVDKWDAIVHLARALGVDESEIAACGDYLNDLKMVQSAGFGVAMENGLEEVKQAADFVTGTNREMGIARAVEEMIHRGLV